MSSYTEKRMLVYDFGASNGRAILGTLKEERIELSEIHRFTNDPVCLHGKLYWDVLRLFHETKKALQMTKNRTGYFPDSIGISTWGASFGLLDKDGDLIANPLHYRDRGGEKGLQETGKIISREELFYQTGYYPTSVFNAYHLCRFIKDKPESVASIEHFINMPELFIYLLTGKIISEKTSAAPSLLYNLEQSNWDYRLIDLMGFNQGWFKHNLVNPGTIIGEVSPEVCTELGIDGSIKVIAVAGHDTTCASACIPLSNSNGYISCGTWSVFGTGVSKIRPTKEIFAAGFTFDEGVDEKQLRKNVTGLWIQQECKRYWESQGNNYTYLQLSDLAMETTPFSGYINVDDARFFEAGNMPQKINDFLKESNQAITDKPGQIMRIIFESLALKYRKLLDITEGFQGNRLAEIFMFGGGIQNEALCQFTADALNRNLAAGPVEATVMGNLIMQCMANGYINDVSEGRRIINQSTGVKSYKPSNAAEWGKYYDKIKLSI